METDHRKLGPWFAACRQPVSIEAARTWKPYGDTDSIPNPVWFKLGYGWAIGFFIAGCLNLLVAFQFSLDFWMTYKLVGGPALTFVYIIITIVYLNRIGVSVEQPVQNSGE